MEQGPQKTTEKDNRSLSGTRTTKDNRKRQPVFKWNKDHKRQPEFKWNSEGHSVMAEWTLLACLLVLMFFNCCSLETLHSL